MNLEPTERVRHWQGVYQSKAPTAVSWYQAHLKKSLSLIQASPRGNKSRVIDVGGGASTLVDDLLDSGFQHIAVLDVSSKALEHAKVRLGKRAGQVTWIEGDVTETVLSRHGYDVWHDRAVFHFLTAGADRRKYVEQMRQALHPEGRAVLVTFSLNGPPKCSGLEVIRYSPEALTKELGSAFELVDSASELHQTPFGSTQEFIYCRFRIRE